MNAFTNRGYHPRYCYIEAAGRLARNPQRIVIARTGNTMVKILLDDASGDAGGPVEMIAFSEYRGSGVNPANKAMIFRQGDTVHVIGHLTNSHGMKIILDDIRRWEHPDDSPEGPFHRGFKHNR